MKKKKSDDMSLEEKIDAQNALIKRNYQLTRSLHRRQRFSDVVRILIIIVLLGGGFWVYSNILSPIITSVKNTVEEVESITGTVLDGIQSIIPGEN